MVAGPESNQRGVTVEGFGYCGSSFQKSKLRLHKNF